MNRGAGAGRTALLQRGILLEAAAIAWNVLEGLLAVAAGATTLAGLILNAAFGWRWADPVAALVIVPLVVREGLEGWRGEAA